MFNGVTAAQIVRAKEINIEEYIISHEPNNVWSIGSALYLRNHESFEIRNGLWRWHSCGIGGKNVIYYLMKVRGYDFVDSVRHLAGDDYGVLNSTPKGKPPFSADPKAPNHRELKLPPRNDNNDKAISYLKGHGIDENLITDCIERGSLYQRRTWANCVFVRTMTKSSK
jgi:hypothetical protein